jgi:cytochrome P450
MSNVCNARHGSVGTTSRNRSILQSILLAFRLQLYKLQCFFLNHPLPLKLLLALLRRLRPVAIIGRFVFVAKAKDVREVLHRLEDFTEADVLAPKMPWGPFIVSIDWPEQHARERELLQSVVSPESDAEMLRHAAATTCRALIEQARHCERGEINVVTDLCEPVVVDIVRSYFGTPVIGEPHEMARLLGRIAGFIMVDPPAGSDRWIESLDCIAELTNTITEQIRQVPQFATKNADLLTRLVVKFRGKRNPSWFNENWIRRYITGLTVFGGATSIRAATQAIDRLIEHPAAVRQARDLARQLEQEAAKIAQLKSSDPAREPEWAVEQGVEVTRSKLQQIIYEGLRLRPMLPLLNRYIPRETMISKGAAHARMAPAGYTLLAPPLAAMYDPAEFPHPWHFSSERCLKNYIHFGYGPRVCFGKYVADVLLVETVSALLRLNELKRASGSKGRVKYDGTAVRSLVLTFKR